MKIDKTLMDSLKKERIIYSAELAFFAILFLVLGFLFGTGVIGISDWKRYAFTILTTIGGIWLPIDLIWTLKSPKRRKKNCIIDKILPVPSALGLIAFDIYVYITGFMVVEAKVFSTVILIVFSYLSAIYVFQAIYHFFVPHPLLVIAYYEEKAKEEEEARLAAEKEATETMEQDTKANE